MSMIVNNRITRLFQHKKDVLSLYITAGFPEREDTVRLAKALVRAGVDMIELGIPFSDPIADGPTIQRVNQRAIQNGMTLALALSQVAIIRESVDVPIVLMGHFNPVLQFGVERFCRKCAEVGIDGTILPDLPLYEYQSMYRTTFESHNLSAVFLVTSELSEERIRSLDAASQGFLYLVSSPAVTGGSLTFNDEREAYYTRVRSLGLRNPLMIGFGIDSRASIERVSPYCEGVIVASAYLRALEHATDVEAATIQFVRELKGG